MDSTTKIIIGAGVLAVGGTAAYFVVKNKQKKQIQKLQSASNGQSKANILPGNNSFCIPPIRYTAEHAPYKKGMTGNTVAAIQRILNKYFNAGLKVDSKFGCKTEAALYKATGKKELSAAEISKYIAKYRL
jgi:hypothetical protein